jgi:hypothetical protein
MEGVPPRFWHLFGKHLRQESSGKPRRAAGAQHMDAPDMAPGYGDATGPDGLGEMSASLKAIADQATAR